MSEPRYDRVMPGVVVGIVEQTTGDPDKLGRIKVRFPLLDAAILSNWCRVASFFAGSGVGAYFLPAKGDEVLVTFEAGNMNAPYVIGALWNGRDLPPVTGEAPQQSVRVIKTKSGSLIRIDDTAGAEKIEISDKGGDKVVIDAAKKSITISSTGTLEITAATKITLSAPEIEIDAKKSLKATAGAGGADITATGGDVVVKGVQIKLN